MRTGFMIQLWKCSCGTFSVPSFSCPLQVLLVPPASAVCPEVIHFPLHCHKPSPSHHLSSTGPLIWPPPWAASFTLTFFKSTWHPVGLLKGRSSKNITWKILLLSWLLHPLRMEQLSGSYGFVPALPLLSPTYYSSPKKEAHSLP